MRLNLRFMTGNVIDDVLYFSAMHFNGLFKMSLKNEEIDFIGSFDGAPLNRTGIHRTCLVYKRWLIFIPQNCDKIHFFNVDSFEQKTIKITEGRYIFNIADAIVLEDELYVFPSKKIQPALMVHLDGFRVETMDSFNDWFISEVPDSPNKNGVITTGVALIDDTVYMGLYYQNKIISYNIKSLEKSIICTNIDQIMDVYAGSEGLWIVGATSGHIESLKSTSTEDYELNQNGTYRMVIENGNHVYAIPGYANHIRLIKGDDSPKDLEYPDVYKNFESSRAYKFFGYTIYKDEIYLFPYAHDSILVICDDKLKVIRTVYEYSAEDPLYNQFSKIMSERGRLLYNKTKGMIPEDSTYNIESYMELVKSL